MIHIVDATVELRPSGFEPRQFSLNRTDRAGLVRVGTTECDVSDAEKAADVACALIGGVYNRPWQEVAGLGLVQDLAELLMDVATGGRAQRFVGPG